MRSLREKRTEGEGDSQGEKEEKKQFMDKYIHWFVYKHIGLLEIKVLIT